MLAHILYPYTELAATSVDIQMTGLENCRGLAFRRVEVTEQHIVTEQPSKVPVIEEQFADLVYGCGIRGKGLVLFHQSEQFSLAVLLQD